MVDLEKYCTPLIIPPIETFGVLDIITADMIRDNLISEQDICFVRDILAGQIPDKVPESYYQDWYSIQQFALTYPCNLQRAGYYTTVTKELAFDAVNYFQQTAPVPVILDPLAGRGFLAKALREQGIAVIATDDHSWSPTSASYMYDYPDSIEKIDALDSLYEYSDVITHLVIAWTPYGNDIDYQLLRTVYEEFPHIRVVNIGETSGGCTGSIRFWQHANFVCKPFDYVPRPGTFDEANVVTYCEEPRQYDISGKYIYDDADDDTWDPSADNAHDELIYRLVAQKQDREKFLRRSAECLTTQ